jgi:hypothetical protein
VGWLDEKIEGKLADLGAAVAAEGEKTRAGFAQAMAETIRGERIKGARPRQITLNATNATAGWSVRAVGGTLTLTFRDGDAGGDVIAAPAALTDGQTTTHPLTAAGISFVQGLYVEATGTGTAVGALWFAVG